LISKIIEINQDKITKGFSPTIVKDFAKFLNYCEAAKPAISKAKEFITRKAVSEINKMLTNPHEGLTARNDQNHYAQVHLFYHLALNGDLFFLDYSKKTKPCFVPNKAQIERYKALNTTEQYLFLFQSFYVYSDFGLITQDESRFYTLEFLERDLQILSQVEINKPYDLWNGNSQERELKLGSGGILKNSSILLYGQYFGLWEITKLEGRAALITRTEFIPDRISLTPFGKGFITFLLKKAPITLWNAPCRKGQGDPSPLGVPMGKKLYDYLDEGKSVKVLLKRIEKTWYKPFFKVMQPFFEEVIQPDFEIKLPKTIKKGNFTLELEMKYFQPKVTRTIQLGSQLSLERLHDAIIRSVGFYDDHLYSFYMDKSKRNGYGKFSEYGEPPFAKDFKLQDFDLSINKKFYYTFDFGDNWDFMITIKDFEATEKPMTKPKLIDEQGESPEQYPSWDEDEEY
jgi:hypothetical protein